MRKGRLKRQLCTPGRVKLSVSGARWSRWTSTCHPLLCQMAFTAAHSQVALSFCLDLLRPRLKAPHSDTRLLHVSCPHAACCAAHLSSLQAAQT